MNALDKKIAELKGWRLFSPGETTAQDHAEWEESKLIWKPEGLANWSTSDAKAFELVDERSDLRLSLFQEVKVLDGHPPLDAWCAKFIYAYTKELGGTLAGMGLGQTRPEAICRAYIAAMEYMKGKK